MGTCAALAQAAISGSKSKCWECKLKFLALDRSNVPTWDPMTPPDVNEAKQTGYQMSEWAKMWSFGESEDEAKFLVAMDHDVDALRAKEEDEIIALDEDRVKFVVVAKPKGGSRSVDLGPFVRKKATK